MLIYRAFSHQLCGYPGALLARLSNFYITAWSMTRLQLFDEIRNPHLEYGDYVRVDPQAVQAIHGSQSSTSKGPWYTLLEPRTSLFIARDRAAARLENDLLTHTEAINGYDYCITKAINDLLQVIERNHESSVNVSKWFNFFAFDVMEDLAFNKNSHMLRDGKEAYIFKTIHDDLLNIALFAHLPWLLPFLKRIPVLNTGYLQFWNWTQNQINERVIKALDALPSLNRDELIHVALLDAVINETLRMHPAVPSGTQRVTPPEGLIVGDQRIPGNTIVQVPSCTVFRDARCFKWPDQFVPERWTTRPDLIINKSVFIHFNIGLSSFSY
ncbi:cytochrome P450 oxidoreductase [Fusarium agapanthi]|uniref:Cytochrome P450 oxidoreductase n=1 Tax=Fusarium agapanthi TaxID=1803897 RepID=A0A9P5EA67_9HYPO|nr:cytochrome P450 oxidoreductase [Fusarium agapanthi]